MKKLVYLLVLLGLNSASLHAMEEIYQKTRSEPLSKETTTKIKFSAGAAGMGGVLAAVADSFHAPYHSFRRKTVTIISCGLFYAGIGAGLMYYLSPEYYIRSKAKKIKEFEKSVLCDVVRAQLEPRYNQKELQRIIQYYSKNKSPFSGLKKDLRAARKNIYFSNIYAVSNPDLEGWNDLAMEVKWASNDRVGRIDEAIAILDRARNI